MFNAQMQQAGLGRQLTGAQALQGLYGTNLADEANRYGLSAQAGGTQQQQEQARLNVPYSDYLAAQQYPFLTEQMLNSAVSTGAQAFPASSTQTKSAPDNSGWGALASIGGAFLFSDERDKEVIEKIGQLDDGQKIYRYRFKGDPGRTVHVGLMAQQVEKKHPGAVGQFGGPKAGDYGKATQFASLMGAQDLKMAA